MDLEKITDLLENGCRKTQNVAVNKWICRYNLIFASPEFWHLNIFSPNDYKNIDKIIYK